MNITPINSYRYGNYTYYHLAPPLPNRAEITMGMFSVPTADPLYMSSTAYGTNANNTNGDYRYVTSAEHIANYAQVANSDASVESMPPMTATVNTEANINKTNDSHLTEAYSNYRNANPYKNFSQLEQKNVQMSKEDSLNYAATNANFNVSFSPNASTAINKLNSLATSQAIKNTDLSDDIDGYIHVTSSLYKEKLDQSVATNPQVIANASILTPIHNLFKTSRNNDFIEEEKVQNKRHNRFQVTA